MGAREIRKKKNLVTIGAGGMASVNTLMLADSPMMGQKGTNAKNSIRRGKGMPFSLQRRKGKRPESS
jgi:hypothetical protein